MGPSGCGKSTLLRVFNRMHELYPDQHVEGEVLLDGENILASRFDVNCCAPASAWCFRSRRRFRCRSMKTSPSACAFTRRLSRKELDERVEAALRRAALWDEVKDKLSSSGLSLSGGQQQRLCIARTIAVQPGSDPARRALLGARSRSPRRRSRRRIDELKRRITRSPSSPTTCSRPRASPTSRPSCTSASWSSSARPSRFSSAARRAHEGLRRRPIRLRPGRPHPIG